MTISSVGLIALSYLIGAIPTSYLVGRVSRGIDLRQHGSGNLGATNAFRVLGWQIAIPVGMVDLAKGALPVVVLAPIVSPEPWAAFAVGGAAVVGHVYSVFMRFRGGKGVATAAGVVLAIAPLALFVAFVAWVTILLLTGYVSLASMTAAVLFPILAWWIGTTNPHLIVVSIGMAGFVLWTHRANIGRLMAGNESRFGRRRSA
ncbi:MAG: glycerol-3-phosphate 1-O-acyltransferase PlsY [Gemmatimonadales bacterium]